MRLGLMIAGSVVVGVGLILGVVFTLVARAVRRRVAHYRADAEAEGILRDSGPCHTTIRYRDYRGPGFRASAAIAAGRRQLLLTRAGFHILGFRRHVVPCAELRRYAVSVDGGALVVSTDAPIDATGHVSYRVKLDDADGWMRALRDAGAAKPAS
jgi:hypothetical protein